MPLATQLSEDQIAEMLQLRQAGRGIKALALQFHVGPDRVRRLVAGVDAPAPPVVRPLPIRVELDDDDTVDGDTVASDTAADDDRLNDDTADEARLVDDDAVDEFIAAFAGVAPLARPFLVRGPGGLMAEVLVDAPDYDRIMRGPAWRLQRFNYGKPGPVRYYVARTSGGVTELLHRVVMADEITSWAGPGRAIVDHINGNPLDDRRCNLRVVTYGQNMANSRKIAPASSRFKGVTLLRGGRWRAYINKQGRQAHLGIFDDEEDAARAYDDAARAEFGECACLNYPREGERGALPPQPADEPQHADEPPADEPPADEASA